MLATTRNDDGGGCLPKPVKLFQLYHNSDGLQFLDLCIYTGARSANIFAHPAHTLKAYTLTLKDLTASNNGHCDNLRAMPGLFLSLGKFEY